MHAGSGREWRAALNDKKVRFEIEDAFERFCQAQCPTDVLGARSYYMTANIFMFISMYMDNKKLGKRAFKLADNHPTPYPWSYFRDNTAKEFFKVKSMMR